MAVVPGHSHVAYKKHHWASCLISILTEGEFTHWIHFFILEARRTLWPLKEWGLRGLSEVKLKSHLIPRLRFGKLNLFFFFCFIV